MLSFRQIGQWTVPSYRANADVTVRRMSDGNFRLFGSRGPTPPNGCTSIITTLVGFSPSEESFDLLSEEPSFALRHGGAASRLGVEVFSPVVGLEEYALCLAKPGVDRTNDGVWVKSGWLAKFSDERNEFELVGDAPILDSRRVPNGNADMWRNKQKQPTGGFTEFAGYLLEDGTIAYYALGVGRSGGFRRRLYGGTINLDTMTATEPVLLYEPPRGETIMQIDVVPGPGGTTVLIYSPGNQQVKVAVADEAGPMIDNWTKVEDSIAVRPGGVDDGTMMGPSMCFWSENGKAYAMLATIESDGHWSTGSSFRRPSTVLRAYEVTGVQDPLQGPQPEEEAELEEEREVTEEEQQMTEVRETVDGLLDGVIDMIRATSEGVRLQMRNLEQSVEAIRADVAE